MIKGKPNIGQLYLAAIFLSFLNVQSLRASEITIGSCA